MNKRQPMNAVPRRKPDFKRANRQAEEALRTLGYPEAPISLEALVSRNNWIVEYTNLHGPDGHTGKVKLPDSIGYVIYIATDLDTSYPIETIKCRQRYTLAHEIGHILMHANVNWNMLTEEQSKAMEVEAHWFAARLLMPDYIFNDVSDLSPELLAEKCKVNYTAAQKRLNYLDDKIRIRLMVAASNLVNLDGFTTRTIDPTLTDEELEELYGFAQELAATDTSIKVSPTTNDIPISYTDELTCFCCGHVHIISMFDIVPIACPSCSAMYF